MNEKIKITLEKVNTKFEINPHLDFKDFPEIQIVVEISQTDNSEIKLPFNELYEKYKE